MAPSFFGIGDRHHEARRLLVHRSVDELAHGHHVEGFGRAVIDLDIHVLAGLGNAVLHHGPERIVGLAMGDDDDAAALLGGDRRDGGNGQGCCGHETGQIRFHRLPPKWIPWPGPSKTDAPGLAPT
jgi:hypothetical protein